MELVIIWLICACLTGIIAGSRGRSGPGWFLIGLILGIFGIILVACLPSAKPQQIVVAEPSAPVLPLSDTKGCPDCGETVLKVANVCKHCGFRFGGQPRALRS